jgi:hypothetical protein
MGMEAKGGCMNKDFFKGVKQWDFTWQGMQAKLPVFYYDVTSLTAIYTASTPRVKERMPLPEMKPIELFPGRCLAAFTAFEYRRTDIDPYNEFSIAFPVTYKRPQVPFVTAAVQVLSRRISAYVWKLPVTTEIARVGGVDMYGYPKFLADIEFEKGEKFVTCRLAEKGEEILRLKGKVLAVKLQKPSWIKTYSVIEGIPLSANVVMNPLQMGLSTGKEAASLQIGATHPICRELRELGLSKTPIQYQYSPVSQAILFAGRNLMDN